MLTLSETAEAFAAEREPALNEAIDQIRPLVASALDSGTWEGVTTAAVGIFTATAAGVDADVTPDDALLQDMLAHLAASLAQAKPTLPGSKERQTQTDALADWIAVMAMNAGTEAAAAAQRENVRLEWVTMGDDAVRLAHREMHGERRDVGDTFDMEGFAYHYPGEPVGPPHLWIRCRCLLRVVASEAAITAAAESRPWTIVVALPAEDDPVRQIGPEEKHATLLYFGEQEVDLERIKAALTQVGYPAFTEDVEGRDTLGDDEADVVLTSTSGHLPRLRDALLANDYLAELTGNVEQYPSYTPHVTLGYPSEGWDRSGEVPLQIGFDRLALWHGDQRWEFSMDKDIETTEEDLPNDYDPSELEPMRIHGVLAVEGTPTGDYRNLLEGEITWRDLPVTLRYTPIDNGGHDGAIVAARIDRIWREGNLLPFEGTLDDSEQASEVLRLIAEGYLRGVSVDLDSVEVYANEETGNNDVVGRIAAATIVQIPAFQEAYVALGPWPKDEPETEASFAISEKPWSGDASRFTIEQWKRSTIIDTGEGDPDSKSRYKLPIREPNGDLSRAGVHAAAARINQTDAPRDQITKAKKALRSAYRALGEDPPEVVAAASEDLSEFVPADVGIPGERGAGWITHPKETSRLWRYWTKGPGAAKIRWGTPNDFYRCRRQLAKYINPIYLNRTCAEWHHDALGIWPGQHSVATEEASMDALVAAATFTDERKPPKEWFEDPGLDGPTPLTVTEEGRVFGHVATWGTCHIGVRDNCVVAPHSKNDYSFFNIGVVETDGGPVSVGTLSMGGGHADLSGTYQAAVAHYDSTSTAAAYIHVGEDEHGIWMAGMVAPGMEEEDIIALRASGRVSGDWRAIGTWEAEDLVAVLAVNVGGFPVPRPALAASAAGVTAMVGISQVASAAPDTSVDLRTAIRQVQREDAARARLLALRADRARRVLTQGGK